MIGLDTNILIRFLIRDEPRQAEKALHLIQSLSEEKPGWISLAVVLELAWVLTSIYGVDRSELIQCFRALLSRKELLVEQPGAIYNAIDLYRKTNVSFADCLIASSARAAGCSQIFTFDRDAAQAAGMTPLL